MSVSSAARGAVPAPRLQVVVSDLPDEVLVSLKGEAGYLEADVLSAALRPLSARRSPLVTFELSELCMICSLALGILVSYHRSAVRNGGQVRFRGHHPNIRDIIEQTKLVMLLE